MLLATPERVLSTVCGQARDSAGALERPSEQPARARLDRDMDLRPENPFTHSNTAAGVEQIRRRVTSPSTNPEHQT